MLAGDATSCLAPRFYSYTAWWCSCRSCRSPCSWRACCGCGCPRRTCSSRSARECPISCDGCGGGASFSRSQSHGWIIRIGHKCCFLLCILCTGFSVGSQSQQRHLALVNRFRYATPWGSRTIGSRTHREKHLALRDLIIKRQDCNLTTGDSHQFRYPEQVLRDYWTIVYLLSGARTPHGFFLSSLVHVTR